MEIHEPNHHQTWKVELVVKELKMQKHNNNYVYSRMSKKRGEHHYYFIIKQKALFSKVSWIDGGVHNIIMESII